ncbi:MAG: class I SAM-dependent methyltransferase [Acidimicrobiales bacterium]|nr:class I SAM-dependent methyltransferase [Acidimicrobiales bacterium]
MPGPAPSSLRQLKPRGRLLAQPGPGDWVAVGDHWRDRLQRWADLGSGDRVLEVGCGPGRSALALAELLDGDGSYDGIDVDKRVIRWCRRTVEPRWPRGHFTHVDVWNGVYNRRGRIRPEDFAFPFPDARFDVAFATSVFTHMLDEDVRRYLGEVRRVLRPGGRLLATFFVIGEAARAAPPGDWDIAFTGSDVPGRWLLNHDVPEKAVAFDEARVRAWYAEAGLEIVEPVRWGEWIRPGGGESYDYQDTVIARRPG